MRALPALLLAGCGLAATQLDPPLGQLARWREAAPALIAAEPVVSPCPAGNPACPRLHALRAEACMALAMGARAPGAACPGPAEAAHLACAGEGYSAALALGEPPAAQASGTSSSPRLATNAAQALLCRAELLAAPDALAVAHRAASLARQAEPGHAATLGARAALLQARLAPPGEGCAAAREAARLAAAAPSNERDRLLADTALLPGCTP